MTVHDLPSDVRTASTDTDPLLHPLLAERRSPRAFDPAHEVDEAALRSLLEAARWAPSAVNRQPWRYLVGRRGDDTFATVFDTLAPGNQLWAGRSSALVVGLARSLDDAGEPVPHAPFELGLSVAQLTVQAHALGLHVHQMAGFDAAALAQRFEVPAGWAPMIVLAVGLLGDPDDLPEHLRARELAPRDRFPLQEIAFAGSWGEPAVA
ncbi:nitroreductase [Motilibacter peucedani]|uniref:Nitroreductase n=1 Tax=Motilibacter peucedani TaxID=598650 RepID=A0A420XN49_9ACTN|nr:nitroreductase family protein [Motilibacter peucedani]RKS72710.1 nitroreductase [Motilibacter peucedani]